MTSWQSDPGEPWHDRGEWTRWQLALAAVATRLREERGVEDPWRLTTEWGALWVEYGDLRVRVLDSGGTDLAGPDDLWDEVDSWVAFDRAAGPGRVLERDRQAMAQWREQLPALRQFWEDVAGPVFQDVDETTSLGMAWRIVVHEDEPVWPGLPTRGEGVHGAYGSFLALDPPPQVRRPSDFPQVWLETPHTGRSLPAMTDPSDAMTHLADLVQEDVIEEVHGAWPPCPRHPHPLAVGHDDAGRPAWTCSSTPEVVVRIGELGRPGIPPGRALS